MSLWGRVRARSFFGRDFAISAPGEVSVKGSGESFVFCSSLCDKNPVISQIVLGKQ